MQRANRKRKSRPRICGPSANLAHSQLQLHKVEQNAVKLSELSGQTLGFAAWL